MMYHRAPFNTLPGRAALLVLAACVVVLPSVLRAKVETWRQETPAAFDKGRKERVVVSDAGRVRLARTVRPTSPLEATRVWDLAKAGDTIYAATGDEGKVFRREGDGPWTTAFDADDSQALALVALPDGRVFCGTGPTGQVVEVTGETHPASRPDSGVQYVWDLAADPTGNLYAATGPSGQLWKRSAEGAWTLLLDSKHAHLLSVAVGKDGSVFAGSDGEGILYRVAPDGKTSVVYDAPQSEIRALLVAPDGTLYAGTAATSGGGSGRGGLASSGARPSFSAPDSPLRAADADRENTAQGPGTETKPMPPEVKSAPGGTAAPRPSPPGNNAVYRIGSDGVAREVFRAKVLVHALAWRGDRLLVGTGPEGQLYEVRDLGRESAPIVRLDHGQVLSLLVAGDDLWLGAGDPGAVLRLGPGYDASGSLTSDVLDAKLISKFGALSWIGETPAGTSIALQVRSGNVEEPDATWSDWSPPQTGPESAAPQVPVGRFAQYRATLKTTDPAVSPEVRSITLRYQTANLPPEIGKVDVPDLSEGDGATRQVRLTLKWEVSDPNGDDMTYTLHIRKEGWPDWVKLGDRPLTGKSFDWDTTSVPPGRYRVRVTASDRPSNGPDEALSRDRESEPFLVDHQAPSVTVTPEPAWVSVALKDDLTRLVKADYALDGGDWIPVFPTDGLFDTTSETLTIPLPDLKPGTHVLMVRATDAAGNVGAGDAVLKRP